MKVDKFGHYVKDRAIHNQFLEFYYSVIGDDKGYEKSLLKDNRTIRREKFNFETKEEFSTFLRKLILNYKGEGSFLEDRISHIEKEIMKRTIGFEDYMRYGNEKEYAMIDEMGNTDELIKYLNYLYNEVFKEGWILWLTDKQAESFKSGNFVEDSIHPNTYFEGGQNSGIMLSYVMSSPNFNFAWEYDVFDSNDISDAFFKIRDKYKEAHRFLDIQLGYNTVGGELLAANQSITLLNSENSMLFALDELWIASNFIYLGKTLDVSKFTNFINWLGRNPLNLK
tara:strand:+ start:7977 stop:8822 length:846 start_codon:yes stop_codon:yes gene_type:complete